MCQRQIHELKQQLAVKDGIEKELREQVNAKGDEEEQWNAKLVEKDQSFD